MKRLILFFLILSLPLASAQWYEISSWERAVCSQWSGPNAPQRLSATSDIELSSTTVSVQAQKQIFEGLDIKSRYSFSAYFVPFLGQVEYELVFANRDEEFIFKKDNATLSRPLVESASFEDERDFDWVEIRYDGNVLRTPVVEVIS